MEAKRTKTADVWRERVIAQHASGRPVRAWCRAHDCPEHGFYWWRAKLGMSPTSPVKRRRRRAGPVAFAEVVVERAAAEPIVLRLGRQRELVFPASMPTEAVVALLHAIEARS